MTRAITTTAAFVIAAAAISAQARACDGCGCVAANPHPHNTSRASTFEQDRKAILAMAGTFNVKFQFHETVAIQPGYELKKPYTSDATELVTVVEDTGRFISLQHVLVVTGEDGTQRVVKHWRQDWTYEDTELLAFQGHRKWARVTLPDPHVKGTWSQAVWQVDDSPRYESFGKWTHTGERSAWESQETWRPLPRREYTKRSDYQVLVVRNRHTITPAGWVHEQDNRKVVLDESGKPVSVIAHETGLNLYNRTDTADLAKGKAYWDATEAYWRDVRRVWSDVLDKPQQMTVHEKVGPKHLYKQMFRMASQVEKAGEYDAEAMRPKIRETIVAFVE